MKYSRILIFIFLNLLSIGLLAQTEKIETKPQITSDQKEEASPLTELDAVYLVEKDNPETESNKNFWELIPQYTSLIQTSLWILLIISLYIAFRRKINEVLAALTERIKKGSSVEAGFIKVGEAPNLIVNTEQFSKLESTDQLYGNPDHFTTLFKVVSKDLKKSTKAMMLDNGCIVQVTTERKAPNGEWNVAEAITFVPNAKIEKDDMNIYKRKITENEIGYHLKYKS